VGLYLCVFEDDDTDNELDGVEVGGYDDFDYFRETVLNHLEDGDWGSRFPTLMNHPDSDGYWTVEECHNLRSEIQVIIDEFRRMPYEPFPDGWQVGVADSLGLQPTSLADTFIDIDGEPMLERLQRLVDTAANADQRIWFQ
jgi:hypothetical protein